MYQLILAALCFVITVPPLAFEDYKQQPLTATLDRSSIKVGETALLTVSGGSMRYDKVRVVADVDIAVIKVTRRNENQFELKGLKPWSGDVEIRDSKGETARANLKVLPAR